MKDLRLSLIVDGSSVSFEYADPVALLRDKGLKSLFAGNHVTECTVWLKSKRVAGVPAVIAAGKRTVDWTRLRDAIVSNGALLLREVQ